jgi:manganese oxidase
MNNRRRFFRKAFALGAGVISAPALKAQDTPQRSAGPRPKRAEESSGKPPARVQTPSLSDLPFTVDNGVKVFHLIAEPVKQQIAPNKTVDLWGFNGSAPGPTIQVTQGDRVRLIVDNHLPEPFSMHWHGFEIPHSMDGGPGISQEPIKPGERFIYEFPLHQEGTYFYHSHMAMQEMLGLLGAFIMHPKNAYIPRVDQDFVYLLQEYAILPNNTVPNTMNMEFNWLVLNGKTGPAITPMVVRLGDRVRIRMVNLGMDHHPMHLHGHTFHVTGTEGGRIPETAWVPGNTVLVGVAQARDVEFIANNPGDWMFHCHLPHHMMNQMSSNVGPLSRIGTGMPAGVDMETGMGMLRGTPGVPNSEDYGPSLGRGLGVGSTSDQPVANTPLSQARATAATASVPNKMPGMQHGAMQMQSDVTNEANKIPGFPQDAYMEGPMMAMDDLVKKPQNYGLRPGWSGFTQGMMTFLRVLPTDQYDRVMQQIGQEQPMNMPRMQHSM